MRLRIRLRLWWWKFRPKIVPWCNEPGCWAAPVWHDGRRRNACSVHALQRIMAALAEMDEDDAEDPTP